MDQQLLDLYHRFVGMAFDRQLRFESFVQKKAPGADWEFDTETAILNFGPKVQFDAPRVGSHAEHNDSWMWSWANRTVKLSITNRALGDTIRALAHRARVPEFAKNAFPLAPLLGDELTAHAPHAFGVVLVGELGYDAYFIAPYDGGRALLLIRDDRLRLVEKHPLARVMATFPQVIAAMPVFDHRAALIEYAKAHGLTVLEESGQVKLRGEGGGESIATFDDRARLAKLEGVGVAIPKPRPAATAKKKAPIPKVKQRVKKAVPKVKPAPKRPAAVAKAKKKPAKKR